jgi:hypothetical protein
VHPSQHREYHQIGKLEFECRHGLDMAALVRRLSGL